MFKGSKPLLDVIEKLSTTAEKRLIIYIKSFRNAFNAHEIRNLGLIRPKNNPSDSFTTFKNCSELHNNTYSNQCNFPIEQVVYRLYTSHEIREQKSGNC